MSTPRGSTGPASERAATTSLPDPERAEDGPAAAAAPDQPGDAATRLPADISALSYEQARDELVTIVARLEAGQVGLEDSLALWQRGEMLATRCSQWLDGAEAQLDAVTRTGS